MLFSLIKLKFSNLLLFFSLKYSFRCLMPGKLNSSNNLILFPVSSETPQEYPAAFEALLTVVSISLSYLINKYWFYTHNALHNFLDHLEVELLGTYKFLTICQIADQILMPRKKIILT